MELRKVLSQYFSEQEVVKLLALLDKDICIIVEGKQGPTGKSTLCRKLKELGYKAVERLEIEKEGNNNTVSIVVSLNEMITKRITSSELFA